jgi:hypothetical protein
MAAPQPIENQQRSYEVFEKKHYMERTTETLALAPLRGLGADRLCSREDD